jgi:sulfur relay (sulfurtransferase) DsrC/TusE family protein
MEIDITKQEAWKLIDAVQAYMKDYTVTGAVHKTFDNITKKLKQVVKE